MLIWFRGCGTQGWSCAVAGGSCSPDDEDPLPWIGVPVARLGAGDDDPNDGFDDGYRVVSADNALVDHLGSLVRLLGRRFRFLVLSHGLRNSGMTAQKEGLQTCCVQIAFRVCLLCCACSVALA